MSESEEEEGPDTPIPKPPLTACLLMATKHCHHQPPLTSKGHAMIKGKCSKSVYETQCLLFAIYINVFFT